MRIIPVFDGDEQKLNDKESEIILKRGTWWLNTPPQHKGWLIDPIIITPTLYKDEYYDEKPFSEIWKKAKIALSKCAKLVIIGYSFAPSDFSSKQLLLESLTENELEELIIIDPNHDLVKVSKELCHYKSEIIWYQDLDEYLQ